MDFINESGLIASVLNHMTINVTGSTFLTLLAIVMGLIVIALMFRLPVEWTSIIVFPFLIVTAAFYTDFLPVLGVFVIYLGILVGKNFFFK